MASATQSPKAQPKSTRQKPLDTIRNILRSKSSNALHLRINDDTEPQTGTNQISVTSIEKLTMNSAMISPKQSPMISPRNSPMISPKSFNRSTGRMNLTPVDYEIIASSHHLVDAVEPPTDDKSSNLKKDEIVEHPNIVIKKFSMDHFLRSIHNDDHNESQQKCSPRAVNLNDQQRTKRTHQSTKFAIFQRISGFFSERESSNKNDDLNEKGEDEEKKIHVDHTIVGHNVPSGTEIRNIYHHELSVEDIKQMQEEDHYMGVKYDLIANRYEVHGQIGLGTFGRVLECFDRDQKQFVAIKVIRKKEKYTKLAKIEADILRDIRNNSNASLRCVRLFKYFYYLGYACLIFEKLGPSLFDFLRLNDFSPFPLWFIRTVSEQLLQGLSGIHQMSLIHTDLKPENILLTNFDIVNDRSPVGGTIKIPRTGDIKIIDFGGAYYDWERDRSLINTRQYRGPEVILQLDWRVTSDLWSAGCIFGEMYQGTQLFNTHSNLEHLSLMEKVISPFSPKMLQQSRTASKYFDDDGKCLCQGLPTSQRDFVLQAKPLDDIIDISDQSSGILEVLKALLAINPTERVSAENCLKMKFFNRSVNTKIYMK